MRRGLLMTGAAAAAWTIAACGGAVDGTSDGRRAGVGACADCAEDPREPAPAAPTPAEDGGQPDPAGPTPAPAPSPPPDPHPTVPGESSGIALRYADLPPPSSGSGSSGGSGGLPMIDPNTLYVALGSSQPQCADPFAAIDCGEWRVGIGIPPALLTPGVLSLGDPRIISSFSAAGADRGGGDCSWGGGSFVEGTLEIVSIDAEQMVVRLADTWTFDFDANGMHTVAFCR